MQAVRPPSLTNLIRQPSVTVPPPTPDQCVAALARCCNILDHFFSTPQDISRQEVRQLFDARRAVEWHMDTVATTLEDQATEVKKILAFVAEDR